MPEDKLTKDQRRDAAREQARLAREKAKKRETRNKIFVRGGVSLAIIAVVAIVALVLVQTNKPAGAGPLNMASDGILIGTNQGTLTAVATDAIPANGTPTATDESKLTASANIVVYLDYLCPFCNQFETTNASTIKNLVQSAFATVEIHPIAILDKSSLGTRYSSRAANAAACVANFTPDLYYDVNSALFAQQPKEGTAGLTNDQLVTLVQGAGVTSQNVVDCIKAETFKDWVTAATKRALAGPLPNATDGTANVAGTPTVLVNGVKYSGSLTDASAFSTFIEQVAKAPGGSTASPTPTPSTTP